MSLINLFFFLILWNFTKWPSVISVAKCSIANQLQHPSPLYISMLYKNLTLRLFSHLFLHFFFLIKTTGGTIEGPLMQSCLGFKCTGLLTENQYPRARFEGPNCPLGFNPLTYINNKVILGANIFPDLPFLKWEPKGVRLQLCRFYTVLRVGPSAEGHFRYYVTSLYKW